MILDDFERSHMQQFSDLQAIPLPKASWKTPDGKLWTPQAVLTGWKTRLSDHWAWLTLHLWIVQRNVRIRHIKLPTPLHQHDPSDPAWAHINYLFGPASEPSAPIVGKTDVRYGDLHVEFGSCAPLKFLLNLGVGLNPHAIVPYECPYVFVFIPWRPNLIASQEDVQS